MEGQRAALSCPPVRAPGPGGFAADVLQLPAVAGRVCPLAGSASSGVPLPPGSGGPHGGPEVRPRGRSLRHHYLMIPTPGRTPHNRRSLGCHIGAARQALSSVPVKLLPQPGTAVGLPPAETLAPRPSDLCGSQARGATPAVPCKPPRAAGSAIPPQAPALNSWVVPGKGWRGFRDFLLPCRASLRGQRDSREGLAERKSGLSNGTTTATPQQAAAQNPGSADPSPPAPTATLCPEVNF